MKKGSPAIETLGDAATALWRKGACLTWRLPADAAERAATTGAFPPSTLLIIKTELHALPVRNLVVGIIWLYHRDHAGKTWCTTQPQFCVN